ncbi:MAG: transketolase [Spirochaetaceae bacterium]|jgi:transketolase|nr:transketolase [Spirochaetaceae bacterium]
MDKKGLAAAALAVRSLSMDAIQKANSGHPGLPLGCAELAAVLYGEILSHTPEAPDWVNRDRFILSAGHGSMLLYAILHLSGYKITIEDIKQFRQVGSICPGHPEYGITEGVEATTGPLGQGMAMAVGQAIAETMLAARFNTPEFPVVDHYTYVLLGEGCLMEGVTSEACSLAGHLKLGKLILFYDDNRITIDGSADLAFSEDVAMRYESYGWQVLRGSMYDMDGIRSLVEQAKSDLRPSFIMLKSEIGHGAPAVAGTAKAHGAPIGKEGVLEAKKHLGLDPERFFSVDPEAYACFEVRRKQLDENYAKWRKLFDTWSETYPEKRKEWDIFHSGKVTENPVFAEYKPGDMVATRTASGAALNVMAQLYKGLVGGSADLEGPNGVTLKPADDYSPERPWGRYIRFGVREFAMAAISNGIQLHGGLRAFCATFLVFADYLRPALRLSALMKTPVIYLFTHDSIYVGEDGPTHQPVETINSLRLIPDVTVLRPGDAEETGIAWQMAFNHTSGPVCLILTRQTIPVYEKDDPDWRNTIACGAYIVRYGDVSPEVTILASGSEVSLALRAAELITDRTIRVVSVINRELFASQPAVLKNMLTGSAPGIYAAEAGTACGWETLVTSPGHIFCISRFGESGPGDKVAEHLGFTAENLAKMITG